MARKRGTPSKATVFLGLYKRALRAHMQSEAEPPTGPAGLLGLRACSLGIGTLALARIHDLALTALDPLASAKEGRRSRTARAASFFAEAMAPIEATHRPAIKAVAECRRLAKEIDKDAVALAGAKRKLHKETDRRKAVQSALAESVAHHRALLDRSRSMEEQLRSLTRRLLRSHEDERKRISRELHDALGQTLAGINVGLATLKVESAANAKGLRGNIARTRRLVLQSMKTVHQFARELRPTMLDDLGLVPALTSLTKEFNDRDGVRVRFTAAEEPGQLDGDGATALYRIAQEALSNATRHGRPRNARVTLKTLPDALRMEVWNDGRSFDVDRVRRSRRNHRLGILCMQERVEMLGGAFSIESSPGAGTTVRAEVPLNGGSRA